jgi:acetyltransferase-like isoleucine patch superfamily enzyme
MKGFKLTRPVEIGNHVWICSDSTVMPGVKIGDGSVVGACSYVSHNILPFTLVQGNPAQEFGQPEYFVM